VKRSIAILLVSVGVLLTVSTGKAGPVTQSELDNAVSCCWTASPSYACTTAASCAYGYPACEAAVFYYLDQAFNKRYHSASAKYVGSLTCNTMAGRGESDDAIRLFVPPAPVQTDDGETFEVSPAAANSLRAATQVMELQRRGASTEELESAAGDDIDVSIEEGDKGERVVTIHSEGNDDIVLHFDSDGEIKSEGVEE
jgi:hypothetical protein